jgi:2-polyprenyl-3-methyl-5-hydroxy-6-metoxy-1,4-benzoquinol methylase
MIINTHCSICGGTEWHGLDYLRDHEYWYQREKRHEDEPVGFKICKTCGYITYDYIEDDRLQAFYEQERPIMNSMNILTANRKVIYHKAFLDKSPEFNKLLAYSQSAKFIDIGCAQGAFCKMLRDDYGINNDNIYGIEVNRGYLSFGKHEYGLNLSESVPDGVKFDFISYYHVLEHLQWPEKALAKAVDMLTDDGIMYISVPWWLERTQTFDGSVAFDFEHLYHLNHVNVFTKQSFKNLLNAAGLEVIQEDENLYALTVMVKKGEKKQIVGEAWEQLVKKLEVEHESIKLAAEQKFIEALKINPKFPDCYIMASLNKENMKSLELQVKVLQEGLKQCPDDPKILAQLAKVLFQWDEQRPNKPAFLSNNTLKCESLFKRIVDLKGENEEQVYFLAMIEGKYRKNYDKACSMLDEVWRINPTRWAECWNLKAYFRKEQDKRDS